MREMKDSGIAWIGEIPKEWKIIQLKNFVHVNSGREITKEVEKDSDGAVGVYGSGGIFKYTDNYLHNGIAVMFGRKGTLGKPIFVNGKFWAVDTMYYLTYKKQIIPKYNYYQLVSYDWNPRITHTALPSVVASQVVADHFPFPPIDEQESIAAFLDKENAEIDALISRIRNSIAEYKKLKQAVITQAVTKGIRGDRTLVSSGLTWVPELPESWQIIPSKFLFRNSDLRKQPGDEQLTASQKYGIISQREYMEREKSKIVLANKGIDDWKHVEPYDFVISLRSFQGGLEMSETTGCITWHYIVLKPCKPIVSKYYKWLFKSEVYIKALQRTCNFIRDGQDLRYSNFVQVPLFAPPLDEQQEIADYLDRKCAEIDRLIAQKEQFLAEIENYKKTLIYEYVTGKKEVPAEQTAPVVTFIDARALLVCRIVELMKPKGRIHLQKAMHMMDCLLGLNNETQYSRHKHGPYDVRIQEYEQAAEKKGWIKVKQGSSVEYSAGAKLEEYRDAYLSLYGDVDAEIQRICAFLAPMKTSQSERVATLLAAWNDFLLDGVNPTDQQLVHEVRTNWTPNKANSPETTWLDTLNKIRNNGFVPAGKGLRTTTAG